ncbi:YT521-B-like domain-containing protein [Podospora didyma]|uniref:YT521-B-like domain-containing protein n=1 Tax=Podospora didyma TaxID=330526 RepID=A0AAE0P6Y9_9PEZI|nr:YT521-B-like domain-containing protein [Podospora didyma]
MGDTPLQPGAPAEFPRQDAPAHGAFHQSSAAFSPSHPMQQQQHQHGSPQHAFASQFDMTQPHGPPRAGPFDFSAMVNALPQAAYRPGPYGQPQQRYNSAVPSIAVPQYGTQNAMAAVSSQQYYLQQQHAQMAHYYTTPMSPQSQPNIPSRPDMGYYPNAVVLNQQPHPAAQYYYTPGAHYPGQAPHGQAQFMLGQYTAPSSQPSDSGQLQLQPGSQKVNPGSPVEQDLSDGRHSVVRGPPRKPRQSGHAIWIGNLPPQTDLMSLVHHVCREAEGLESLFLISKSNCAFANFKDELACVAAQRKLHDSKFLTVRLVSRLRKSTVEGPAGITAPTGPAAVLSPQQQHQQPQQSPRQPHHNPDSSPELSNPGDVDSGEDGVAGIPVTTPSIDDVKPTGSITDGGQQKDRFFILKSLTVEDLELSVKTNIWATQSHNEETLNSAFSDADNVYLVFSANKSGEYFGYARMVSPINDDPAAAIEFAPKAQPSDDVDLPKAIPTESTEFAPKGRIIDDSARGTIFWEAERDEPIPDGQDEDGSGGGSVGGDTGSVKSGHEGVAGGEPKAWGKPFRLEWLSTARLPFYRTRGLRNPWNSNREVKIARDGTELEPSVGRRLIGLFNRAQSPSIGLVPGLFPAGVMGGARHPMQVAVGFSPMRSV